jgi:puromycin-sensitive aminopeptidase
MSKETAALMEPETQSFRLPRSVVPEKYEIRLEPDLTNYTFDGEEVIHVVIAEPVKEIVVNSLEIEISSVSIANAQGEQLSGKVTFDIENEMARFEFQKTLDSGTWKLAIKFKGKLNDKLHGFYRSTYKDAEGNAKTLATTQFEATDARRAFPCFDEPDLKAVFRVTLVVDKHLTAISNGQVRAERLLENGKREVRFDDTMKMSTYLVAFVVGEFEATDAVNVDGTPVRLFAPPGKKHLTKFAEGIATHSLSYFNSYYGLKYPGDKLEFIAVPDFAFGAMENLGAVIFRENALLVDEKTASHAELERVADVVAHEIAHMWFGDLATMKWWNGLWLNEAFATFMEMLAVDAWKTQWKRWETFGVSRAQALATDGLKSTRTIEFPVNRPEEAQGMFDVLTYEKGGSVLRMLEQYLGAEAFRRGINLYLAKHKYSNTETHDLWEAIEESSKQPVRSMMDSWIFQGGHPLVTVERDGNHIKLTQQRFLYSDDGSAKDTLFHVPVLLRAKTSQGVEQKKVLLTERSTVVEFEAKPEWVVANEGGHGFYRVRYSPELLEAMTNNLQSLAAIERFNLVNDMWAATIAGLKPLSEYIEFASLFQGETDKNVWTVLIGSMQYMERLLGPSGKEAPKQLSEFVKKLAGPAQRRLGWEPQEAEDELTRQLRGMLIGVTGTLGGDAAVRKQAVEMYEKYRSDKSAVSPDVVPALVSILAYCGDEKRFEEFLKEYKEATSPQEEDRYMYSLAVFRDAKLLSRTLEKSINGEVRTQNAPYLLRSVMMNTEGRDVAWKFAKDNWDKILSVFPDNSITRMCEGITALISDDLLKETKEFFAKNEVKQGKKIIEQHQEKQAVAVAMKAREAARLRSL